MKNIYPYGHKIFGYFDMFIQFLSSPLHEVRHSSHNSDKTEFIPFFVWISEKVNISVGKVSAIKEAVRFLYNGIIEITKSTLKDLLEVADYLQIDDLKSVCTNYLNQMRICPENCLYLCLLASKYELDYYNHAIEFVKGHLPEVLQQQDALDLTSESVQDLLEDPHLTYVPRSDLFSFIVKWVEHDDKNRIEYFEEMFCELDLKKMARSFLESSVELCTFVSSSDRCKVHLLNVKMKHMAGLLPTDDVVDVLLLAGGYGPASLYQHFFAVPFLPMSGCQPVSSLYAYIVAENRWAELAPLPESMCNPLLAYSEPSKCLYVYSGVDDLHTDDNIALIQKYDLLEKSWSTIHLCLPEPLTGTHIHKLMIIGNSQFIVASGYTGYSDARKEPEHRISLISVKNDMTQCYAFYGLCTRNMETEIKVCEAADRYICILCYRTGNSSSKRNRSTRFFLHDTQTGNHKEFSRGAAYDEVMFSMKNEVFVTKPGSPRYKKFDVTTKRWTNVKEILIPKPSHDLCRTEAAMGSYNNQLYLFGGKVDKKLVNSVTVYDFMAKSWKDIENIPKVLSHGSVLPARVPGSATRCHINCPHCKFVSIRSQTSYMMVDLPEDEDDQDLSSDDDMYSDFWGNDAYDELDMYPDLDWF